MAQLTNKVKDHFLNPRNVGKLESASVIGRAGDARRNSNIKLFIKLRNNGVIEGITYQIFNNAPAIAPASAFTEIATGKSLSEASEISKETLMTYLECDEDAARNIRFDILDAFAHALAIHHGEAPEIEDSIKAAPAPKQESPKQEAPAAPERPKLMIMQLVQDVLDSEIRPAVAMDGGDVELVDVQDKQVHLRLHGHCVGCSSSNTTMRFFVEDRLRELVDPGLEVVDVTEFSGETHAPPGMGGIH